MGLNYSVTSKLKDLSYYKCSVKQIMTIKQLYANQIYNQLKLLALYYDAASDKMCMH